MRLFSRGNIQQGSHWPKAWVNIGRADGERFIHVNIPLFILKWGISDDHFRSRFGWYVPHVSLVIANYFPGSVAAWLQWGYTFHSDLMGERQEQNYMLWREAGMQLGRYVESITEGPPAK